MQYKINEAVTINVYKMEYEDRHVKYVLIFEARGKEVKIEFCLTKIYSDIKKIIDYDIGVKSEDLIKITNFIQNNTDNIEYMPLHNVIGFARNDNSIIGYCGSKCVTITDKGIETYNFNAPFKASGCSVDDAIKCIKEYINDKPIRMILITTVLAAVICGITEENILTCITGESSTGKTIIENLGISMFAKPDDDRMVINFNDTENAMINKLGGKYGVPVVLDDTSLSQKTSFNDFVYLLHMGKEKSRVNKYMDLKNGGQWSTSIIISSENCILDYNNERRGAIPRILEFEVANDDLFDNADHADKMKLFAYKNYGKIGMVFVEYIFRKGLHIDMQSMVTDETSEIRNKYNYNGKHKNIIDRKCRHIAIVILTAKLLNNAFDLGLDIQRMNDYMMKVNVDSVAKIYKDEYEFAEKYEAFYEMGKEFKSTKHEKEGYCFVPNGNCDELFRKCSITNEVEWKKSLLEHKCLLVNDGKYTYRFSDERGLMFKCMAKEVI